MRATVTSRADFIGLLEAARAFGVLAFEVGDVRVTFSDKPIATATETSPILHADSGYCHACRSEVCLKDKPATGGAVYGGYTAKDLGIE